MWGLRWQSTRSRRFGRVAERLLALVLIPAAPAVERLPVFLADNHAESLGWITRHFDLDRPLTLVLVDAHSDASAAERSEEIREGLRRVASVEERARRVEDWRAAGRLQAFNWIEPLMPRPVGSVVWVAGVGLDDREAGDRQAMAGRQCDGRLEVEPRSSGPLADRWRVVDLAGLVRNPPQDQRVIWSLDLDFFAGMEPELAAARLEDLWAEAMGWPGLEGVCVAVSRPWLNDDAEADRLVGSVLSAVARTRGARLEIDASLDDRPDRSLRASDGPVARWDFARSPARTRDLVALLGDRCRLVDRTRPHDRGEPVGRLEVEGREVDVDGIHRLPLGDLAVLRVRGTGGTGRVRWFALDPAAEAHDLIPRTGLGKGFSEDPARWVFERRRLVGETRDGAMRVADLAEGPGRFRIRAEWQDDDGAWRPLPTIELALRQGDGFRGALSECFRLPYVFGIGEIREGDLSGVETGWGSDCANLLAYGWRRTGQQVNWADPGGMRAQLRLLGEGETLDRKRLEEGVMIDFGRHVAALWEDLPPLGEVGPEDLVLHQLGGPPELVQLGELQRGRPDFTLWLPRERDPLRLRVAGDVAPVGGEFPAVDGFESADSDLFLANLEGVPTELAAVGGIRYDFRFPPQRVDWLAERGLDGVSLANNHAGDAGPAGIIDAIARLERVGIGVFGAGRDVGEACRPWVVERHGRRVACFGISLVPGPEAGAGPGIAMLPAHARRLEAELAAARSRGESIVVLVHGGDEYRHEVNDAQRRWARWLVARGASVIAGSGPHVVQRRECHGGAVILHSLGNAVFPGALQGADEGVVVELDL